MKTNVIIAMVLCLMVSTVYAHQQKTAVTTISFNHRVNNIEVMHKFYLHDAEHAVRDLFDPAADILSSKATQNTFADYVQQQFAIETSEGHSLPLSFVGLELDGKYLWLYQETSIPKNLSSLSISNGALQDLWPAQINLVNIEGKGKLQSLLFDSSDNWLSISLSE
ncbi:hypothetical protein JK628_11705 [Shewanella sp. KX20019]|uniref:DUF6702 family protein n=1 Tax=Shewanella sp. KX20019 TaxID=2803864 RepID=UPI0019253E0A|nr:DUF6702 family protein [Shewanella sp. KX20019]QQX78282.1 hypothetical protein JK628_11705 [Shewanella sp. KX20019]